ncbi:MAG: TonB-dependent receptor, partial [Acidobacteriaceae bacterium]|nr:TonB-dependent receptor [Acidobacteriaceae bacterium]
SSGEAALIFNPGGFEAGGASSGLYANKYMPSASDTLTKVIGTHTAKIGFFYEWIRNAQPANNNTNGYMQFVPTSNVNFTTGNAYADMLEGNTSSFAQANFNRINDISYNTYEGFIQDSWKLTPRLTIEAGLRMTHFTPWADDEQFGYSVFIPSEYKGSACTSAPTFCGFNWHSRESSVAVGGFPMRAVFWQPRFGLAYDVFGKGQTVVRGGWGRFYYHSGQFTSGLDTAAGSASITITPNSIGNKQLLISDLASIGFNGQPSAPGAVDSRDDKQPYTDSYSFTISQRTPLRGLLELGYVGNQSHNLQSSGGYGSNINLVPVGAIFKADPVTGSVAANPSTANANHYRPYVGYSDINLATNNLYSNYNAFQLTWAHQGSRATIQLNYTFGKALGICCGTTLGALAATYDPFNLNNDYGPQPGDRRHLFNTAYSINLPSPIHDNRIAAGVVNGWQISGITQWESGANLVAASSGNFNLNLNNAIIPGTQNLVNPSGPNGITISNQSLLGTNAIQLNPIVTCNPRSNLGSHQWINPSCFAPPSAIGQNGPTILPSVYGPAFFNSDLGLFKNFQIKEDMKVQFRVQASNFLNHPLWSMSQGNALNLSFTQATPGGAITQSNPQFGTAQYKTGQRIVELQVKFYF